MGDVSQLTPAGAEPAGGAAAAGQAGVGGWPAFSRHARVRRLPAMFG